MTNELVKILEAAKEHHKCALVWFRQYQDTNDQDYWICTQEEDYAARGLLQAYEIMTGRKVYSHAIDEELEQLKQH